MSKRRQKYDFTTDAGERVYTKPGNRGPNDMQIFSIFPKLPWKTTLQYIGIILRLKGIVEDRNYPRDSGYQGAWKLLRFIKDCIVKRSISIHELCKQYEIPENIKSDGFCLCGLKALPNDKWCKACREALDLWDKL